jgi:hypothetical protein
MKRLTLATAFALAVLLMCSSPSRIEAQGNTPIVIKDGGSLLLQAAGLDAGDNWTISALEIRHKNTSGVLGGLQIKDAGADQCGGKATCGVDPTKPWRIRVSYGAGWVTIASYSANKGVHLTHRNMPFDKWAHTSNGDEREFGHGDGHRISGVKVNGGANLCSSGKGCEVDVTYRAQ